METITWLWNGVTNTAESVKKRAISVRDWMWTNKGKSFAIFATITTLIYLITLVRRKRNPNNLDLSTQTPQVRNAQFRSKMQSYYENAQRGSNNTVNLLSVSLRDKLEALLEIPSTAQLRSTMNKSNEEKVAIWDQVKLLTFTRTISAVYGISLLFLFLRTKVNILGRYLYLDATVASGSSEENPITEDIQKKYLIYSDYFLNTGIVDLVNYIQKHAEQELTLWPLTRKCTFEDVLTILTNIRVRLEEQDASPKRTLYSFLLPQENSTEISDKQLLDLLNETRDVLESDQFARALRTCLNASFIGLANQIKESFIANTPPSTAPTSSPNPGIALPMAKIIPLLNQKFRMLLDTENKTSLLNCLFTLREVDEYSNAIFTSSYDEE